MLVDDLFYQGYSLGHPHFRQADQAGVGECRAGILASEVFVYRDQDPVFRCGPFQLCQPAPGAPVYDESHVSATETEAKVSPEMTVWA